MIRRILITGAALLTIYLFYRCYYILTLAPDLDRRIRSGAVVLDVRTRPEWKQGHIDGAVNIPLSELHNGPIPLDTGQAIITCCSHGLRSVKAAAILKKRGFRNVSNGGSWTDLEQKLNR